jgi:hypothetical protein
MKIVLEYAAVLDVRGPPSGEEYEIPDGSSVSDLLTALQVAADHHRYVVPFVGGRKVTLSARLKPGDRCFLSLPIGGG